MEEMIPDTRGLEVFTIIVDTDNPRWNLLRPIDYGYLNPQIPFAHIAIKHRGKIRVRYAFLYSSKDWSLLEYFECIRVRNIQMPDRAIAETVFDGIRKSAWASMGGACPIGQRDESGRVPFLTSIGQIQDLIRVYVDPEIKFSFQNRVLAVISEEPWTPPPPPAEE